MKKPLLISGIAALALTAISIILLTPQNGDDLETAAEYEVENLREFLEGEDLNN